MFSFSLAVWAFCFTFFFAATDKVHAKFWYNLGSIGYCTYFALILHFCLLVTNNKLFKKIFFLKYILYFPSILFLVLALNSNLSALDFIPQKNVWHQITPQNNLWFYLYISVSMIYIIFGFYIIFKWYKSSTSRKQKKQAKIILCTGIPSFLLGSITNILLPTLNIWVLPPISHIIMLVFIFGIRYAVTQYKLMILTPEVATNEILSKVIDMILISDTQNNITMVNPSFLNILGYSEHDVLGKPVKHIFENNTLTNKDYTLFKNDLNNYENIEVSIFSKQGDEIPVNISTSVFYDDSILIGRVFIIQDMRHIYRLKSEIEEKIRLTDSLIETNHKLKELDNLKSDFLTTASYELKTPLSSVLSFSKVVKSKLERDIFTLISSDNLKLLKISNQIISNLDIIIKEVFQLTDIVNDVLDLTKLETGSANWNFEYVQFEYIINQAINNIAAACVEKRINLELKTDKDLGYLYCDKNRILQVLYNIFCAAIQFSNKSNIITFLTSRDSRSFSLTIEYYGTELTKETQKNIFESFKHIFDSSDDNLSQTAMSLPICKKIIQHHGGKIWIESEINYRNRFCFTLPIIEQYSSSKLHELKKVTQADQNINKLHQSKKLLIVAAENKTIRLFQKYFEEKSFDIIGLTDSVNTFSATKSENPDLIIMDLMMPKINGLNMAAMLKNCPDTNKIPIFLLTAIEPNKASSDANVDGYFNKPINFEELYSAIEHKLFP